MSGAPPARRPRNDVPRYRVWSVMVVFLLFVSAISYRVVGVQVVRSEEFGRWAVAERTRENVAAARRGEVYDARGVRLATNVPSNRVSAILSQIDDTRRTAELLSPLIGRTVEDIDSALNEPELEWVLLARRLTPEVSAQIVALGIEGIVLDPEPSRMYPFGTFASHVLGFTTYDLRGAYGVEGHYDDVLGGSPGKLLGERDGAGNLIALSQSSWDSPIDGADIVLTLDSAVQYAIERILADVVAEQSAAGGTIIVQHTQSGAILGMASLQTFDPNTFNLIDDPTIFLNPAISMVYEPGSTFKSVVMAIGLDDGVVYPDTLFNDDPGYFAVSGHPAITNSQGIVYGAQTMTQVLEQSANLGAIFVAQKIGRDRFYQRLVEFGFGYETGVDLQGEEVGILTLPMGAGWNDVLFYTNSFGQGIAVTPLQLVNAVSALGNGGRLMQPYIVAEVRGADGTIITQPTVIRQVISEETSAMMRMMLESAVLHGTGELAAVEGYRIGAKTGTAQIPSPNGGYIEDATIASIVGFAPIENPLFTVLVKIDWPKELFSGQEVSAPVMARVFEELFLLYGIAPFAAQGAP
ncbi:MAG TPA: penicillin-binding transpeptidase domain-containing protein [Thermomicrobiales bacterium]|nr:penicillin-binding transpeptidase domain-containing protein [Thermomicrobiales bacterium]